MPSIYKVGGCVRDRLLGLESKDIDFTFVLDDISIDPDDGFLLMKEYLQDNGYKIFLSTPNCFTIRAKFPASHKFSGLDADFVLARKEIGYTGDSRKPILALGTIDDDLMRRDFTVNAMAEDEDGILIDLFSGKEHLERKLLVTPLDPVMTFSDDPLRILRAIRFSITKGFDISDGVYDAINNPDLVDKLRLTVSEERIREEMTKCFACDTKKTLNLLWRINENNPKLIDSIFSSRLWLQPTLKAR